MPNDFKYLHIEDSYNVWSPRKMRSSAILATCVKYWFGSADDVQKLLNRSWRSIYIEWWLHNIGYYLTKPFCKHEWAKRLNKRFKDVDLEEWK